MKTFEILTKGKFVKAIHIVLMVFLITLLSSCLFPGPGGGGGGPRGHHERHGGGMHEHRGGGMHDRH